MPAGGTCYTEPEIPWEGEIFLSNIWHDIAPERITDADFMAVVDYGCAADGLSGAGGDAKAMTEFAEAALNPKAAPTGAGSLSVSDAVSKIYREGRNKLAHGEESGLFEDQSDTRAIGDNLLSLLMNELTPEIAEIIANRPQILTIPEEHAYRALITRLKSRS